MQGPALELSVRDAGMGMTPEQIEHAFDLFAQFADAAHRTEGGLGIGLALVRGIVALHDGTVEARSDGPGHGAEFVVRLPLPEEGGAAGAPGAAGDVGADARAGARRVLVVDDNVDAATMLASFLELSGHRAEVAHTGRDAVAAAARFVPEMVLLDIGLPDISGYEVAREVRAVPGLHAVMLVAVTGWGQAEDRRLAREAGFDFHVVKPADPADVLRLLAALPPASAGAPPRQ